MIQAKRQQPGGDAPSSRDLLAVQDNVNLALAQLQLKNLSFVSAAPAKSTSPGAYLQAFVDLNYLYICVSSNTWRRISLGAF